MMEELELVSEDAFVTVSRIAVPGGWLYVTQMIHEVEDDCGRFSNEPVSVSTTFVPEAK